MQLVDLKIENLEIPFKVSFEHSTASRASTQAVLVTATTNNGNRGLGEGCPRSYVTGETLESAHLFFNTYKDAFLNLTSLTKLSDWVTVNQTLVDENPAAFCAVELALLNAMAQDSNINIETLLSLAELSGRFRYSAVIGSKKSDTFANQLKQYLKLGFTDFKIKLFGEPSIDNANIKTLKKLSSETIRVRFDANNLWSDPDAAIDYICQLNYPVFALEEPLKKRQYTDCGLLAKSLDCKIILDESFTVEDDFTAIKASTKQWIINLRISKMGGVLRSLAIANRASDLGIPVIIGAQVGETSILTRAGLIVANACRENLIAQEGAFGTHLLKDDIVKPPIMFGRGGWLDTLNITN